MHVGRSEQAYPVPEGRLGGADGAARSRADEDGILLAEGGKIHQALVLHLLHVNDYAHLGVELVPCGAVAACPEPVAVFLDIEVITAGGVAGDIHAVARIGVIGLHVDVWGVGDEADGYSRRHSHLLVFVPGESLETHRVDAVVRIGSVGEEFSDEGEGRCFSPLLFLSVGCEHGSQEDDCENYPFHSAPKLQKKIATLFGLRFSAYGLSDYSPSRTRRCCT